MTWQIIHHDEYNRSISISGTEAKTEQGAWNSLYIKIPKFRGKSQNELISMGYKAKKSKKEKAQNDPSIILSS